MDTKYLLISKNPRQQWVLQTLRDWKEFSDFCYKSESVYDIVVSKSRYRVVSPYYTATMETARRLATLYHNGMLTRNSFDLRDWGKAR